VARRRGLEWGRWLAHPKFQGVRGIHSMNVSYSPIFLANNRRFPHNLPTPWEPAGFLLTGPRVFTNVGVI
jgi:hypothetical protein